MFSFQNAPQGLVFLRGDRYSHQYAQASPLDAVDLVDDRCRLLTGR